MIVECLNNPIDYVSLTFVLINGVNVSLYKVKYVFKIQDAKFIIFRRTGWASLD